MKDELISRQAAIDAVRSYYDEFDDSDKSIEERIERLPSAEQLTDEELETIRIHMNAFKEKLCNQHRWKEAEEYQLIVDKLDRMMNEQSIDDIVADLPEEAYYNKDWKSKDGVFTRRKTKWHTNDLTRN